MCPHEPRCNHSAIFPSRTAREGLQAQLFVLNCGTPGAGVLNMERPAQVHWPRPRACTSSARCSMASLCRSSALPTA